MTEMEVSRTRILRKILVALATGAGAYSLTELTGQPQIWSVTLSVFIGGVTLVVQLLMDFDARLARVETVTDAHSSKIEDTVEQGFARINEATQLFGLVEASAVRTDAVTELVRHASLIDPTAPPLVSGLAQAEICRVSEVLKELGEGTSATYEGEDRDWLLALARHVVSSIDATSLTIVDARGRGFVDGGFWSTDLGLRYLAEQREAVRRGVRIRRLFIVQYGADPSDDAGLVNLCRLQQEAGIEVRVLPASSITGTLRNFTFDFVLFDEVVSYEATPASQVEDLARPSILRTRLELRPERVKALTQRFRELWDQANALE